MIDPRGRWDGSNRSHGLRSASEKTSMDAPFAHQDHFLGSVHGVNLGPFFVPAVNVIALFAAGNRFEICCHIAVGLVSIVPTDFQVVPSIRLRDGWRSIG